MKIAELSPEYTNDVGLMLNSCKDIESAQIPISLEQIVQCIQMTGKQSEFGAIDAEKGVAWLQENCRNAYDLLQVFLKTHGHRAFAEVSCILHSEKCHEKANADKTHIRYYSSIYHRLRGA